MDHARLAQLSWRFAKTMAHLPHEYVVRSPENENDYADLFQAIKDKGVSEKFMGSRYRYWYAGDGYKYWAMSDNLAFSKVINRAKVDEPGF